MKNRKNKVLLLAFVLLLTAFFTACTRAGTAVETLETQLARLDGVVSVTQMERDPTAEGDTPIMLYMLEFEQPIDWSDSSVGTFRQRVMLGFKSAERISCYYVNGYMLKDCIKADFYKTYTGSELEKHYDANFIDIEYRFFGESCPEGLSLTEETYWQYMTSENASQDFHHIITELGKVLTGPTVFYGGSKGGYATENMAYYYPDDIDAYVSYCAPFCNGEADTRFYQNLHTAIGNLTYGEEVAAQYRNELLELQTLLLDERFRESIQSRFLAEFDGTGNVLSSLVTGDEAYEAAVEIMACNVWQYSQDFASVEKLLAMGENTPAEIEEKAKALEEYFMASGPATTVGCESVFAPYYVQSYLEMGNLAVDFSYLRNAGANVKTPAENDATLLKRLFCPIACTGNLTYSSAQRDRLEDFFNNTEKTIVKIEGLSDTWYAVRAPETENEHIHLFTAPASHLASIAGLEEGDRIACSALIDSLLGVETDPSDYPDYKR